MLQDYLSKECNKDQTQYMISLWQSIVSYYNVRQLINYILNKLIFLWYLPIFKICFLP